MRTFNRIKSRGFTLVELMIVVAIIGVLAALAIYGVRKYLASAKSAEAKNAIGAINRGAVAAFERENMASQLLAPGQTSLGASHSLCASSIPVPNTVAQVQNHKYQPQTQDGLDYNTGDTLTGWKCLKYGVTEPQYYEYQYERGAATLTAGLQPPPPTGWASEAKGDLDANNVFSLFQLTGDISNGQPITSTTIATLNPEE